MEKIQIFIDWTMNQMFKYNIQDKILHYLVVAFCTRLQNLQITSH